MSRTWTWGSRSAPGVVYTTTLADDGRFYCTCKGFQARHDCSHCAVAAAELAGEGLGYDPFVAEITGTLPALYTTTYWAYQPSMGLACRITVGAPRNFAYELDDGLRWALAPWPPLFSMIGEAFEAAYRQRLEGIGVERIRQAILRVAARHATQDKLTLLCWEPVWGKPDWTCHRRVFAAWWEQQTRQAVEEWPARPRSSPTQPTTPQAGRLADPHDPQADSRDQPSPHPSV